MLVGRSCIFSVSVAGQPETTTPTGMVRLFIQGTDASDSIVNVSLANGSATTPFLDFATLGTYTVTANYLGDAVYSPSSSTLSWTSAHKLPSVTLLEGSVQSIGMGGADSYEVGAAGAAASSGTSVRAPTGTVQLYVNGVAQGSPVTLTSGLASANFPNAGTYTVTAVYSGDAYWLPSTSDPYTQTVLSQPPTLKLQLTTPTLSGSAGNADQRFDYRHVGFGFFGSREFVLCHCL